MEEITFEKNVEYFLQTMMQVEIQDEVRAAVRPHMGNWSKLSTYMMVNDPPPHVVTQMIRMELEGKNRIGILGRLVSRLSSHMRVEVTRVIQDMHDERKYCRTIPSSED